MHIKMSGSTCIEENLRWSIWSDLSEIVSIHLQWMWINRCYSRQLLDVDCGRMPEWRIFPIIFIFIFYLLAPSPCVLTVLFHAGSRLQYINMDNSVKNISCYQAWINKPKKVKWNGCHIANGCSFSDSYGLIRWL